MDDAYGQVRLYIDEVPQRTFDVTGTAGGPSFLSTTAALDDGPHAFRLEFANPDPDGDRVLVLDAFSYDGPLVPEIGHSDSYDELVGVCAALAEPDQDVCADLYIREFGARAWRRPLTAEEGDWLASFYDDARALGLNLDLSLQMAFKATLLAPDFVFRFEQSAVDEARPLGGYELASRLSYFLWSSMPDDELFAAAADGSLLTDEGLEVQVVRMLADPKAAALVEGFAGQWLDIRGLDDHDPIGELYPSFDEELKVAMKEEVERAAADWLLNGMPGDSLLLGTRSWMNARLAEHYGATGYDPAGDEWQLVDLTPLDRQGILTTPAWLTVTSHADRPSVVERGKWIFEELLCTELPPPPPNVEGNVVIVDGAGSVREQEEALRLDPDSTCVACHSQTDPYGHSLGMYDAIGAYRTVDELGFPIDAAVVLPDGTPASGILDVLPLLAEDPRFTRCIAEKLFVYGTGRVVRPQDAPFVEAADATFLSANLDFAALARHLVLSTPFRTKGTAPLATPETP